MGGTCGEDERVVNMHRFYVDKGNIINDKAVIRGDDVKHIVNVLRFGVGDSIVVCDGENIDYDSQILEIKKEEIIVCLSCPRETSTEPPVAITLFQSIPKGTKMELIIQKGTEIGINYFVPVITSRTIVNLNNNNADKKINRWYRIASEAAKQSRRGRIPQVLPPVTFREAMNRVDEFALSIMPCVEERTQTISSVPGEKGAVNSIALFIGPEGGFDKEEVLQARAKGVYTIKMGARILRTETAGLVTTSILMYRFGDLGGV